MKEKYYSDCIKVLDEVGKVVIGKDDCIRSVMAAVLAEGHILIDDVPGVGKTSLATAFAKAMGPSCFEFASLFLFCNLHSISYQ